MIHQRSKLYGGKVSVLSDELIRKHFWTVFETVRFGAIAGAAGGLTEIAWVTLYAAATGGDAASLARGVTTAAGVSALLPATPVTLGLTVHITLAVMLGVVLASVWRTLCANHVESVGLYAFTLTALLGVWAINFFVVLPIVSPAFVHLVPYWVSLISKVLFGVAVAEALCRQNVPVLNTDRPILRGTRDDMGFSSTARPRLRKLSCEWGPDHRPLT